MVLSDYWMAAGGFLILVGALSRSYAFATLGLLLIAIVQLARLWSRYSLSRVTYSRELSDERVYAGETVTLEISLTNSKPLALPWVLVEDRFDPHLLTRNVAAENANKEWEIRHSVSVGWYERVRWKYTMECSRRGYHRIGPATLRSGDPFGFGERERRETEVLGVLVYPRLLLLEELGLHPTFPFEGTRTSGGVIADPLNLVGARPYVDGDPLRQVHWRASARSTELQSKVLRPTTESSLIIFLDLASSARAWEGINVEAVERAISAAATLAHRAHDRRWALGLYVNGIRAGTHQRIRIGAARGDETFSQVLDVLARVPPFPTIAFADLLRMEKRRLPAGATVVAISVLPTRELSDQLRLYRSSGYDARLLNPRGAPDREALVRVGVDG